MRRWPWEYLELLPAVDRRIERRERLEAEAIASGRAGYFERRVAAQARLLRRRLIAAADRER